MTGAADTAPLAARGNWFVASKNRGKIEEFNTLLAHYGIGLRSSVDYSELPAPEENGKDFHENALIKARYYSEKTGVPALSDDSGLCVNALGGAPGLHSARYAEEAGGPAQAIARLERDIAASAAPEDRRASFVCVLCLCFPDGTYRFYEGECAGTLTFPPRGEGGFGYDPAFIPEGYERTFAELPAAVKHQHSHRARALEHFRRELAQGHIREM